MRPVLRRCPGPTTSWTVAAELADEFSLRGQRLVVVMRQAVVDRDVHADQLAADPAGHARRAADQRLAAGDAR